MFFEVGCIKTINPDASERCTEEYCANVAIIEIHRGLIYRINLHFAHKCSCKYTTFLGKYKINLMKL